jgi:hypothetical protein
MMILAYAYAVQGYHAASLLFAAAAALSAVGICTGQISRRMVTGIFAASIVQLLFAGLTSLPEAVPETGILTVCNTAVSFLFLSEGPRRTRSTVQYLITAMFGFYTLSMVIPSSLGSLTQTMALITLIFLPVCAGSLAFHLQSAAGRRKIVEVQGLL